MKRIITYIYILSLIAVVALAQGMQLQDAFALAVENNYDVLQVKNATLISEISAKPANAGLLPTLSASAGLDYGDNLTQNSTSVSSSAMLSLNYTLFNGWSNLYSYKILKAENEAAVLQERLSIENTLLNVAETFFAVLTAQENIDAAEEQLRVSEERLAKAKEDYEQGNSGKLTYLNAQVDLNSDKVNLLNAENELDMQRQSLNELLGQSPDLPLVAEPYSGTLGAYDITGLKESALIRNASYLIALNQIQQSDYSDKSATSAYLPSVNLNASYGYGQTGSSITASLQSPDASVNTGLTVSWDLFSGTRKAQKQIAKINLKNANLEKDAVKIELLKELQQNYTSYSTALSVLEMSEASLEAATLNFEQSQDYFDHGMITSTAYREAQLNVLNAKKDIAEAKASASLYELTLMKLSGQLINTAS